jgi:hypothetical protein
MEDSNIEKFIRVGSVAILMLFPVLLMFAFALHFRSFADFFEFKLMYVQNTPEYFMSTLTGSQKDRLFLIPHYVGYLAMPFMLATALVLGKILYRHKPVYTIIGVSMTLVGVVFLSGVFAAWLSFAAVANVPSDIIQSATLVLKELTTMQGPLLYITSLSILSLAGLLVLGVGLFQSKIQSRLVSGLFILGNLMIIIFMDLDNWMFLGALLILISLLPLSKKLIHNELE